jgi:Berberine and berberine like
MSHYESLEVLVDTWQHWAPFQTKRLNSVLELFTGANHNVLGIFNGPQSELLDLLAPVLAVPGSNLIAFETVFYLQSWLYFADEADPPTNDKFSSNFAHKLLPPEAISILKNALDNPVNSRANFWFPSLGGVMRKISKTATPFWNRDALFYFEWDKSWSNDQPEQVGPSFTWVENLLTALSPYVKGSYVNVPDMDKPNWGKEYYGKNFSRLKKIKRKYDPTNFFTYEVQAIPLK